LAKLRQRLERACKTTTIRCLHVNLALKRTLSRRAHCVFVAAMPKSASTFLATCLAETTGFARFFLGQNYLAEQDLYMPRLIDAWSMNIVCQQHVRAVRPNLELMAEFSVRPVVLVRDIGDALVSLREHLDGESPTTPVFDADASFLGRDRTAQLNALVDIVGPWYVGFYAGWAQANIDKLWLSYDEVVADPSVAVGRVLDHHAIERTPDEIARATDRARGGQVRLNVGRSGRGHEHLTTDQRDRLRCLARHFPDVDFAPVGLGD